MGRFKGLASVKTNQGGVYFEEGDYEVSIEEIKFQKNRKKQDQFVVSATVITSTNPERGPGSKPAQIVTIRDDILETCWGNVKQFAGALLELPDPDAYRAEPDPSIPGDTEETATERFWDESLEYMVHDSQPMKGTRIKLNVTKVEKKDQSKGKYFSKHVWGPVISFPEVKE